MKFLKISKFVSNIKLSYVVLLSVVFLFIFSNYLYKMPIFKLGFNQYLEKQQSDYNQGPTYRQRYNSTNNANSDNPWDYKNETYSDYLKSLTTLTGKVSDYVPNDFTNSKLSLYDANLFVYSDKYVRDEFPNSEEDGQKNRSHWYNPIASSVHYGPDYIGGINSKTFGFEKWKDNFLPPNLEDSLNVQLFDPSTLDASIIISSNNYFENIKSIKVTNNASERLFTSSDIQTWRDDKSNIPSDLKVTPPEYRGTNSKFSFQFEWENTTDSSYDGKYEFMGYHNPYDHEQFRGGQNHYLLKGPDRVDGYDIDVNSDKIQFDKKNKEYSIPIKWKIEYPSSKFPHIIKQVKKLLFSDDFFPWVNVENEWFNFERITPNNRSMVLSSIYYGYGLDKNLSIIDNTNLLRTLSFFTSPGDVDSNPINPGIHTDGIIKGGPSYNTIFTSHLDNKYFMGEKGKVDTRYYKFAYRDKDDEKHYMKNHFIYRANDYYTRLLPWVDAYTINNIGEYDLIDSQYIFDPNKVVWKIIEMNENDAPIVEVDYVMKIKNNSFRGKNSDNLILDIVNYAPYAHEDGVWYNKFVISSNNIVISINLMNINYFFDYYLNYEYMNISFLNEANNTFKFKSKMFVSSNHYNELSDKKIQYYVNNDIAKRETTKYEVQDLVILDQTDNLVPVELVIDIPKNKNIESIAFFVEGYIPKNIPIFNPVAPFGSNLFMEKIELTRNPNTKELIIMFIFNANSHIENKYYYWGSELITQGTLTPSTRMKMRNNYNTNDFHKIISGCNTVNVIIDEVFISSIINLKDNFIFGYSGTLTDYPTQDKTFKVYNDDLHNITIPKAGKSDAQKRMEIIIILISVGTFLIIISFATGIGILVRSNKRTRMFISIMDDDIFDLKDMEEDFELSLK